MTARGACFALAAPFGASDAVFIAPAWKTDYNQDHGATWVLWRLAKQAHQARAD